MNSKHCLIVLSAILILFVCAAYADEPVREDLGYTTNEREPVAVQVEADVPIEVFVETVLDPRITAVEESYSAQMDQLESAILSASDYAEKQALQQEVKALKIQWALAVSEVQLEIAREAGNDEAVSEIQESMNAMLNPPQRTHTLVQTRSGKRGSAGRRRTMKKILLIHACLPMLVLNTSSTGSENIERDWTQRIVFEKYLFADGVSPKARYLDRLIVKFFDEDMIRLRDNALVSTINTDQLDYTKDFYEQASGNFC